jgi:hypothetical protein
MEIQFPDDSSRRLLNNSSEDYSNNTSGVSVTEIKETNDQNNIKKKFTVTKHIQQQQQDSPISDTESTTTKTGLLSKSCLILANDTSPNTGDSLKSENIFQFKNNDSDFIRESDDVFDENLVGIGFDTNATNRYAEGQDTITSLKNTVFVKQLADIKRKASLKSNKSSSANSIPSQTSGINNANSIINLAVDIPATPQSKRALPSIFFKSQESIVSKKVGNKFRLWVNGTAEPVDLDGSITTVNSKKMQAMGGRRRSMQRLKSTSESNSTNIERNPEILIDTITEAINNNKDDFELSQKLMEQIKFLLAQNDDLERRRRRYLKRIFKLIFCFFVIFTVLMGIIVISSLFVQLERIENHRLGHYNLTNNVSLYSKNNTLIKWADILSLNKKT